MRILQLIDSLNIGGSERMSVNISNVLSNNGHEVILCASRQGGSLELFIDQKVNYIQLYKRNGLDIFAFFRLLKLIRKYKIQLIHAHSSSVFWAVVAKLLTPGMKVIWHDHLGKRIEEDRFNRIIIIIISFLIDGVIAVNEDLKNWSLKKLHVNKKNIVFINNFPLLNPYHTEINKNNAEVKIVCLANLRPQKDHITLIKAVNIVVKRYKIEKIKVILAGLIFNDDYYHKLIQEIESNALRKYFEIAGSVSDTFSLLYQSDIGVLSSVSEGLPVSLLEYGLASLPVVVTNVGECAEVVDNGVAGMVVPPSDPEAMAAALLDLIEHPEKRAMLGSKLKERVEKEYGAGKFLDEYNKLIENL